MKRVRKLLEGRIREGDWIPKSYSRDFNLNFFLESIDRLYLIHYLCVQEVSHTLELWDHKDIAETLYMTFTGFRYIYESLADSYIRSVDELSEIRRSSLIRYVSRDDASTIKIMTDDDMCDVRMKRAAQLDEESRVRENRKKEAGAEQKGEKGARNGFSVLESLGEALKRGQGGYGEHKLDFSDREEAAERELREKKALQAAVDQMKKDMEEKNHINFENIRDPKIILEFNNQMYDSLINESKNQQNYLRKMIMEYEGKQEINLKTPGELQRLVYINTRILEALDLKGLVASSDVDDEKLMRQFSDSENSLFKSFNEKQRNLVCKVVQIIKQSMAKDKRETGVGTFLSSKDVDKLYASANIIDHSPNKETQRELNKAKQEIERSNSSIKYLREKVEELLKVIEDKENLIKGLSENINAMKRSSALRSSLESRAGPDHSKQQPGESQSDMVTRLSTELKRKETQYLAKDLECETQKKRNESMWNALDYARRLANKHGVLRTNSMQDMQVIMKIEHIINSLQTKVTSMEAEANLNEESAFFLDIGNGVKVKKPVAMKHVSTEIKILQSKSSTLADKNEEKNRLTGYALQSGIQSEENIQKDLTLSVVDIARFFPKKKKPNPTVPIISSASQEPQKQSTKGKSIPQTQPKTLQKSQPKTHSQTQPKTNSGNQSQIHTKTSSVKHQSNHTNTSPLIPSNTSPSKTAIVNQSSTKSPSNAIYQNHQSTIVHTPAPAGVTSPLAPAGVTTVAQPPATATTDNQSTTANIVSSNIVKHMKMNDLNEIEGNQEDWEQDRERKDLKEMVQRGDVIMEEKSDGDVKENGQIKEKISVNNPIKVVLDKKVNLDSNFDKKKIIDEVEIQNEGSMLKDRREKAKEPKELQGNQSKSAIRPHSADLSSLFELMSKLEKPTDSIQVRCLITKSKITILGRDLDPARASSDLPLLLSSDSKPLPALSSQFSVHQKPSPYYSSSTATLPTIRESVARGQDSQAVFESMSERPKPAAIDARHPGNKWQASAFTTRKNSMIENSLLQRDTTAAGEAGTFTKKTDIAAIDTVNRGSRIDRGGKEWQGSNSLIKSHRRNMSTNVPDVSTDHTRSLMKSRSQVGMDPLLLKEETRKDRISSQNLRNLGKNQSMVSLERNIHETNLQRRDIFPNSMDQLELEEYGDIGVPQEGDTHHGASVISHSQVGHLPNEYQVFVPVKNPASITDQANILLNNHHENDEFLERLYMASNHSSIPAPRTDLNLKAVGTSMLVPSFHEFKSKVKQFVEKHASCGPRCIHLQRFYDRCGLTSTNLKSIGNRQPYIFPLVDMSKRVPKSQLSKEVSLQIVQTKRKDDRKRDLNNQRVFI